MLFSPCPYSLCLKTRRCSVQDPAPSIRCGVAELCELLALEHPSLTPPRPADRCRAPNSEVHTSVPADQTFLVWESIEYLFSFFVRQALSSLDSSSTSRAPLHGCRLPGLLSRSRRARGPGGDPYCQPHLGLLMRFRTP